MKGFADLSDDLCQPGVAHHQPAAGSDAVGLVLELVWLHFVEVLEAAGKMTPCVVNEHTNAAAVLRGAKGRGCSFTIHTFAESFTAEL